MSMEPAPDSGHAVAAPRFLAGNARQQNGRALLFRLLAWVLFLALTPALPAAAQSRIEAGVVPAVGIDEKMGTVMPLDAELIDEAGRPVRLRELMGLPVLLVFVYYRCPAICDPLLREIAANLDLVDLRPGVDYRVISISFDPQETPEVARTKKGEILGTMTRRPPDDAWRFLTGSEESVRPLTEAAGFIYRFDEETQTYVHASSLIFLTGAGRIVRYLGGLQFVPPEIKMALIDAQEGRQRTFMQKVARVCYSFNPQSRTYVLRINRIILALTGVIVLGFVAFLVATRKRGPGRRREDRRG